MIDETPVEEQAKGLVTFTIVAGLGGAIGYAIGGNAYFPVFEENVLEVFKKI